MKVEEFLGQLLTNCYAPMQSLGVVAVYFDLIRQAVPDQRLL
jgi:hypothetical protein